MTVSASGAVVGFGCQTAKGTQATTWYRHKAIRADVGPQQDIQQFPPEIGGGFHPTGAFKRFAAGAGQMIMHPRLEDVIGWLFYGAVGDVSDVESTPEAGMTRHIFTPPSAASGMKWMSVRREIPGSTGDSDNMGEILKDARCAGMRLAIPAGGLLTGAFTFVAREPKLSQTGVDSWTWDNTYETYESVPLAPVGSVTIGGDSAKATNIVMDLVNQFTTPQEELIVGSYYPDDFILQQQVLTCRWTYKWEDGDLYKSIFSGTNTEADDEIEWDPSVHTSAFVLDLQSPDDISGLSNPYRIKVTADEFSWQTVGPVVLEGGGWLSQDYVGVAQEQVGADTLEVWLENEASSYTWPS